MIHHPERPSDEDPQVVVSTGHGNVTMTFWKDVTARPTRTWLHGELSALPLRATWRANALHGVVGTRLEQTGMGSGSSINGCHLHLSVNGTGCSPEEFDAAFELFTAQVMQVAI